MESKPIWALAVSEFDEFVCWRAKTNKSASPPDLGNQVTRKVIRYKTIDMDTNLEVSYVDEAIETGQVKMEIILCSPSSCYFACCLYISGILKAQHIKKYLFVINGQTNACIIA